MDTNKGLNAELFAQILDAEQKAEQIIRKAEKEKEGIISKAKQDASSLMIRKLREIDLEKERRIQNFQSKVYVLKDTKKDEAKQKIKKLDETAKKNMQKCVDFVFEKFMELVK